MTSPAPDPAPMTPVRRHDLDAVRAFAMLLGLVLHAGLSFMDAGWVIRDTSTVPGLDLVIAAIHGARMPVFFLLSGFFTAMMFRRRGTAGMLRHRAVRVAIPLGIGCATIVPATWWSMSYAMSMPTAIVASSSEPESARDEGAAEAPAADLWSAAGAGDLERVTELLDAGAPIDTQDPAYGLTPLAWAVLLGHESIADELLARGADPGQRYRDGNAPIHTAAFFGRGEIGVALIDAGADVTALNPFGQRVEQILEVPQAITEGIAQSLDIEIDFEDVAEGRAMIRARLAKGDADDTDGAGGTGLAESSARDRRDVGDRLRGLMAFPFFHHLWFLWFLSGYFLIFGLLAPIARRAGRVIPTSAARVLGSSPGCLLWTIPLCLPLQMLMRAGGAIPGFGPDTSAGLIPLPHVFAYYAVFFAAGAMLFSVGGASQRLGRGWLPMLLIAAAMTPFALGLSAHLPWATGLIEDDRWRHLAASFGETAYAWLVVLGITGLAERVLHRERPWVRWLSDASYWTYLGHLPLIFVLQGVARGLELPGPVELVTIIIVTTATMLFTYRFGVRYTPIGRLLNGPRVRPR